MGNEKRFDGRVAIVTGAGGGLGRSHALLLASRGAKVVVNDLGGSAFGDGKSAKAADAVVDEIKAAGGEAVANYDSVENGDAIVKTAMDAYGRLDILINNAGILRDVSFHKMSQDDWDLIYKVHVLGSFRVTHAAWPIMRDAGYGRIVMTASAAGIYGNFGQANYGMAKLGLLGFANTLAIEGARKNIHVNTIAPIAGSRLTETVLPEDLIKALKPEYVSPLVALLCHEECEENGGLYELGGGYFGKLRWQRTKGKIYRLGRPVSIEDLDDAWSQITDFDKVEYPENITASMGPIMENVQAGPSKGGNKFIDVDEALGYEFPPMKSSYDERDLALYALGVGAANNPLDDKDLQLVYEMHGGGFKALPTYAVIPALNAMLKLGKEGKQAPGINYGFDRVLHGEQYTEIKRPLPAHATLTHKMKIRDIWDKGKGAVVVNEIRSYDEDGDEIAVNVVSTFVRGAGGWGGDRGPSAKENVAPERKPDAVIEEKTDENQALLYRLSGDWNPLHADPTFAKAFGFDKPILHGLCTFGFAGRHVIQAFCDGDPRYFKSIKVRFADSVFPGETLVTEMWKEDDGKILFQCKVKERDSIVISNAAIELYKEIPKKAPKKKPAAAAAGAPAEPISADVFAAVDRYLKETDGIGAKVGKVFKFELSNPDATWIVSAKDGEVGAVQGDGAADTTLALSDADFMAMSAGKADPMKLFSSGKLKISGDVMASQKLSFLQKVPPEYALASAKARGGGGGGDAAAPAAAEPTSADAFLGLQVYVERNPDLVKTVGKVFVFKLSDPESAWTIDLKNGAGSVTAGEPDACDTTLALSDADFMAMSAGKADPMKLFTGGKLKISGDVMASQKLDFLSKVNPEELKDEVLKRKAAGAGAGAAPSKPKAAAAPNAPKVLEALEKLVASNGGLVGEVGAVVQLQVKDPDAAWTLNLKDGAGSVASGTSKDATTTITIGDADLGALASGKSSLQSLYQHGKLRVDGDVSVVHRLGFLTRLA